MCFGKQWIQRAIFKIQSLWRPQLQLLSQTDWIYFQGPMLKFLLFTVLCKKRKRLTCIRCLALAFKRIGRITFQFFLMFFIWSYAIANKGITAPGRRNSYIIPILWIRHNKHQVNKDVFILDAEFENVGPHCLHGSIFFYRTLYAPNALQGVSAQYFCKSEPGY